jgi:hypothetical protein
MLPEQVTQLLPDLDDPEECLRRANACEQIASREQSPDRRSRLMKLAGHWRELANEFETHFRPEHRPQ